MSVQEKGVERELRDKDELEFIRVSEVIRRTRMIMKRDSISEQEAREKACAWITSETGQTQMNLPLDAPVQNVYRVYYRRFKDDHHADYRLLDVLTKGVLYAWQSTNLILADIIRDRFDDQCDHVVVFHLTQEHDYDIPSAANESKDHEDDLTRRRKIADLEKQLEELRGKSDKL